MNFVETCRKGAGWPSLHRDVPIRGDDKKAWSMSQEEVAKFVGQVRSRSDDLASELREKTERIAKLADEKAQMANDISALSTKLAAYEMGRRVKAAAESMGLEAADTKRLESAVTVK